MPAQSEHLTVEYIPIADLKPFTGNPRKISEKGLEKLRRSVSEFGFVNPILAQRGTGLIIAGHQRLKAAQATGLDTVPVVWLDFDDVTAKAYNVADNRTAQEAEWDFKPLADLLQELDTGAFDLTLTGFDADELQKLADWTPDGGTVAEDEAPEPPAEPVTKPGDIWLCGKHRVMCGDSTVSTDVDRLLAGAKPFIMVTDPPYGVEYNPEWREQYDQFERHSTGKVRNDNRVDWSEAYSLFTGDVAYVWHAGVYAGTLAANLSDNRLDIRAQIVWVKQHFVFGRGAYHWQHEPCWYAVRRGKKSKWGGSRDQSTTWNIANKNPMGGKQDDADTSHGTQKPVECMARPIRNHGGKDDAVYDPFLGSGTTMIAAEQLNRQCFGLEIDPGYCDVIVLRWMNLTHQQATLEGDGRTFEEIAAARKAA